LKLNANNQSSSRDDDSNDSCASSVDQLRKLIQLTEDVYFDLYLCSKYYRPIFENEVDIHYFTICYKIVEASLMNLVKDILTEEIGNEYLKCTTKIFNEYTSPIVATFAITTSTMSDLNTDSNSSIDIKLLTTNIQKHTTLSDAQILKNKKDFRSKSSLLLANLQSVCNYNTISEPKAIQLFELYINLKAIKRFQSYLTTDINYNNNNDEEQEILKINTFHDYFYMPFMRWIDLMRRKIDNKLDLILETEEVSSFDL
jgi:hypothetical protein